MPLPEKNFNFEKISLKIPYFSNKNNPARLLNNKIKTA